MVKKVIKIKATEKGVWAPAAVTAWGVPTTAAAVAIAVAGGGVAVLEKLRKYRLEKISDKKIILYRK